MLKVVEAFRKPFVVEGHRLSVGISIGIQAFPSHGNYVNILVQRGDIEMYMAKRINPGYAVYDPSKDTHSIGRLALMSEFRNAIEKNHLRIYHQPIARLSTGKLVGVEALSRWKHHDRGFFPPEQFIPLAEHTGLMTLPAKLVLTESFEAWFISGSWAPASKLKVI